MRRAALAILCLLTLPAVSAKDTVDLDLSKDFTTLSVEGTSTMEGDEAAEFRGFLDAFMGDGDGEVSQDEADAFTDGMEEEMAGELADTTELDGREPEDFKVETLAFEGLVGPVDSPEAITLRMQMELEFEPRAGNSHELVLVSSGESEEGEAATTIVVHAPEGYVISAHEGGDGRLSSDNSKATFTDSDDVDISITFTKDSGSKDSPAAGLLVAGVLLAVAGVLRRRI